MIDEIGSINITVSPGRPRTIRTKNIIQKINSRLKYKKRVSSRKLAQQFHISVRKQVFVGYGEMIWDFGRISKELFH